MTGFFDPEIAGSFTGKDDLVNGTCYLYYDFNTNESVRYERYRSLI